MFDEATRRDLGHRRRWICLLDGNAHQIDRVTAEAEARHVRVTIIVDFIHVLEYLSAPRSARLYPPPIGEGLEEGISGSDGLPEPERERGQQHASQPTTAPRRMGWCVGGPA
jgi:hypothetical protein